MSTKVGAPKKVDANPTKAFFVRMITRDINLEDCILDLIDNSIDGAWKLEGAKPLSLSEGKELNKYIVDITANEKEFIIRDNCGGITLDDAAKYAFTFGRKEEDLHDNFSIGIYGIGMKRAVFKLGTNIKVRSTYIENDQIESFQVPIVVPEWLQNTARAWDFDIEPDDPLDHPGVEIVVTDLTEGTSVSFANPAFIENLIRTIARDYSLHLHRGLRIKLNGREIKGWQIQMREGGEFSPMFVQYEHAVGAEKVRVEILAGMAAPPPEDADPDEADEGERRFGWYVVCNGRIVVAADKTALTGWGVENWPQWHRQYSGFIGLIMFTSENASLLPLTTTKRNVETSSTVYRQARPRMRDVTRKWIDYTNLRKQALPEAKQIEAVAKPVSIFSLQRKETVVLPRLSVQPKVKSTTISYSMPAERIRKLGAAFGNINMSAREVGTRSFEYSYKDNVGE